MSTFYELWDLDSGNMIGDFDSEAEALAVVHDLVEVNTPSFVDLLSLGCTSDDGTFRIVAQGRPLAVRADRAAKTRAHQILRSAGSKSGRTRRLA